MKKLPCPFCGNIDQETIVVKRNVYAENDGSKPHDELNGKVYWYVQCFDCDARTGDCWDGDVEIMGLSGYYQSGKEWAIDCWNMRREPRND